MEFFYILLIFLISLLNSKKVEIVLTRKQQLPLPSQVMNFILHPQSITTLSERVFIDISNYQNLQYYAPLHLGSSQFEMTFLFDTGSNQLWFPTLQCTSECNPEATRYNTETSSHFHLVSNKSETIYYGMGEVEGFPCQEQLWLTSYAKVDKMPCLAVFREKNQQADVADGILGLAPYSTQAGHYEPPFILDVMKQSGLIQQRTLFLFLRKEHQQSVIVFGDLPQILAQKYPSKAVVPIINPGDLYYVPITGTQIGGKSLNVDSSRALIDSGTSLLLMPNSVFQSLIGYYEEQDAQLLSCGGFACGFCDNITKVPLQLQLKYYTFKIPFEEVWQIYRGVCFLRVYSSGSNEWILGDIFVRNYAIYIDYDRSEVSFYGNDIFPINNSEVKESKAINQKNEPKEGSVLFVAIGIGLLIALLVAVVQYLLKLCSSGNNLQRKEIFAEYNLETPLVLEE